MSDSVQPQRRHEKIRQTDELALEGLSEDERATLMTLLGKIRENLLSEQKNEEEE